MAHRRWSSVCLRVPHCSSCSQPRRGGTARRFRAALPFPAQQHHHHPLPHRSFHSEPQQQQRHRLLGAGLDTVRWRVLSCPTATGRGATSCPEQGLLLRRPPTGTTTLTIQLGRCSNCADSSDEHVHMASERGGRGLCEQTRLPAERLPATPLELRTQQSRPRSHRRYAS